MSSTVSSAVPVSSTSGSTVDPSARAARLFGVTYTAIGTVVVVDQLLLPMFHIGTMPFKIAYVLLGMWAFDRFLNPRSGALDQADRRDVRRFATAMMGIIACVLLGEMVLGLAHPVTSYAETVRTLTFYVLWICAFGLGASTGKFNLKTLYWIFSISVALNLAFILLRSSLPAALINFYYSDADVVTFTAYGVQSARDIIDLIRPRGLFLNPNASMLMVNIIVVMIYVSIRNRLLATPSTIVAVGIIVLPLLLATLLVSRSEFIVSAILALANTRVMFRGMSGHRRVRLLVVATAVSVAVIVKLMAVANDTNLFNNLERITTILAIADRTNDGTAEGRQEGVARPLLMLPIAFDRFSLSPLFGSGYSSSTKYPFDFETRYFHNDWFSVAVSSGLIGVLIMLWILRTYCLPLGLMSVIPFVLPGLTNTFILNIPAMIFYWFMIGVLRKKIRSRSPVVSSPLAQA